MRGPALLGAALLTLSGAGAQERRADAPRIDTIQEVSTVLGACWRPPFERAFAGRTEMTVRFAMRRDGALIGPPRVTYASRGLPDAVRERYEASIREAFARCIPLALSPALGASIAGRPFALRLVHDDRSEEDARI